MVQETLISLLIQPSYVETEIEADVILKGTRVDGIFTSDPEKDSSATMYESISFDEVFKKELSVMDLNSFYFM